MPNPQLPPLKFPSLFAHPPYKSWFALAQTLDEHVLLIRTFNGIPKEWIEWSEKRVVSATGRGIIVANPLSYRLSVLWNGLILLQESKFLCDSIENALRNVYILHSTEFNFNLLDTIDVLPNKSKWESKISALKPSMDINSLIMDFSFGELTQMFYRNWYKIGNNASIPGFISLFYTNVSCRDASLFINEMSFVRNQRNEIAHSKRLFLSKETTRLFKIAQKWLTPLHVDIEHKIINYRVSRPRFLQELGI